MNTVTVYAKTSDGYEEFELTNVAKVNADYKSSTYDFYSPEGRILAIFNCANVIGWVCDNDDEETPTGIAIQKE